MTRVASHPILGRGPRRAGAVVTLLCASSVLVACGSSSPEASLSTTATGNGVASKSPAQIVASAQKALRSTHSFVAAGIIRQGGKTLRLQIVNADASTLQVQIEESGKTAEIITTSSAAYVRANQRYWSTQAGAGQLAARVANRWIKLPSSAGHHLSSGLGQFTPGTLARCLGEDLGKLSRGGRTTIDGKQAIVVRQAADVPGSSPGTLAVATIGPAFPLRLTTTGPTRPGGKVDVCNSGKANDVQGNLVLRDFDHAPAVTAPKHPLDIEALSGSSA